MRLPVGRWDGVSNPVSEVSVLEFAAIARSVERQIPALTGCVRPGMGLGLIHEQSSAKRPPKLEPVQWAGLFRGVIVVEGVKRALERSGLVAAEHLLAVWLRPDRTDERYFELRFPFAARVARCRDIPDESPCHLCGRLRHKWRGRLSADTIPREVTHFVVSDFPTKFVVRSDLAEVLLASRSPTLSFDAVEVVDDSERSASS